MFQTKNSTSEASNAENLPTLRVPEAVEQDGRNHADDWGPQEHGQIETSDLLRIIVTGIIAVLVWFHVWEPFSRISLLGIAGVLCGGYPIFREALENIDRKSTR